MCIYLPMKRRSAHGKPVVLTVEAGRMYAQGFVFYQADNGVWLTQSVPVAFIRQ